MLLRSTLAFSVFLALTMLPAVADMLPVGIVPQSNSPVTIQRCISGVTDSEAGNSNYYLDFAGVFKNRTERTIKAFRLRFDIFNNFNEHLTTLYGTDQNGIAPGEMVDDIKTTASLGVPGMGSDDEYLATWQFINTHDTSSYVVCSVDTVRFTDGPMWQASVSGAVVKKALSNAQAASGHFWVKSDE